MVERISPLACLAAALVVALLVSAPRRAVAAGPTFTVDSELDQIDDDVVTPGICHTAANTCTLRAAIMEANRASGAGATIVLPAGLYPLTILPTGSDGEASGDLNLTAPVSGDPVISIVGASAESTIIDASTIDRAFSIEANRTASISGVTIHFGYRASGNGGGIDNEGTLTISNAAMSDNYSEAGVGGGIYNNHILTVINSRIGPLNAAGHGGGIFSFGDVNVRRSTIEGNVAVGSGGGIYTTAPGGLTLRDSTISSNHALSGGGVFNSADTSIFVNTTISNNSADHDGGGIFNDGILNVYNTTIVSNAADWDGDSTGSGGGVRNSDDSGTIFNLRNTLVAGNFTSRPLSFFDDCGGTLTGYGENLFKAVLVSSNCTIHGAWGYFDGLDKLGPLQDNGGPTQTHALLAGSNAIDGTSGSGCVDQNSIPITTDQRGAPRISGVRCDIGAFEVPEPGALAVVTVAIATLASMRTARRDHR